MNPAICIVDDDDAVRHALQRMLRAHGFAISIFASGEEFLNSAAARQAACLILDVRMAGMTGLDLHRLLTAQGCRIPTILITACPTQGERERAIAAGITSYLAKPFSEDELLRDVRSALAARESLPGQS
jgi:FixJ family two-component response regulator